MVAHRKVYAAAAFLPQLKPRLVIVICYTLFLQVAELATQMYITNDKPNVAGLVLSGSADFKTELSQSDMFDPRLQAVVLGVVDVSYGESRVYCLFTRKGVTLVCSRRSRNGHLISVCLLSACQHLRYR
jgi:peptide subunit release factor 1 (eRF1)